MRSWMVNPLILCQKHILGEHAEHHMFCGTFRKRLNIQGYIDNNLLEPLAIPQRHDVLAFDLIRRQRFKNNGSIKNEHKTWIDHDGYVENLINYLSESQKYHKINVENALYTLMSRCDLCKERLNQLLQYDWFDPYDSYFIAHDYSIIS